MFKVSDISYQIEGAKVVNNVSFALQPGTVTVCMGANGSGKSSLVNGLAGHPNYEIVSGSLECDGKDLTGLGSDKRAQAGLFLSLQYPIAIPGVTVLSFLQESFRALNAEVDMVKFQKRLDKALEMLNFDKAFLARNINEGFSGGEKKRCEMVQLLVLQPKIVLLDEIDSGLDVDALKLVGKALIYFMQQNPHAALFIITHYQNILEYIKPDQVLIMAGGKLVKTGNAALLKEIEQGGYDQFN
jgi:Fe-S cluster assembly ATP-binding protein